ncbi:von Willebrand factor [Stieleria maiorica]|uniref:von Willebrand factor n=1 Tax=Stieleria maiorica TaxID=2795974 RepID=A0A5B9M8L8_9BACT|nr:von Willebrand factor type A domain-containing protein [Stieleria maiorica]QEF96536.1 von Willebrand factor [Stieleria maiorica]
MASEPTDQYERIEERATAFVFGELEREEATEFMKLMDASPEVRAIVASVRDAVGAVKAEFASETVGVNPFDRRRIENAIQAPHPEPPPVTAGGTDSSTRLWVAGLAVAATLLLISGLTLPALNRVITANTDTQQLQDRISQIESENQRLVAAKRSVEMELAAVRATLATNTATAQLKGSSNGAPESVPPAEPETGTLATSDPKTTSGDQTDNDASAMQPALAADSQGDSTAAPPDKTPDPVVPQSVVPQSVATQGDAANLVQSDAAANDNTDDAVATGSDAPRQESPQPNSPAEPNGPARSIQMNPLLAQPVAPPYRRRPPRAMNFGANDPVNIAGRTQEDEMMMGAMTGAGQGGAGPPMPRDDGDRFAPIAENPFMRVASAPLSTFPMDVDPTAYAKLRINLNQYNQWPAPESVRVEEWVNYFDYHYAPPQDDSPFAAAMEIAPCPWNPQHRLARIGIKAKVPDLDRPPSNLVFLVDVSGSMNRPNKMPLVVDGIKTLVDRLGEKDSVAIVVYAGAAGIVLDSTSGDRKKVIVDSLDRLRTGGSTDDGRGIQLAYDIAREHFISGGINRVIVCSDGDFNVGLTDTDELVNLAQQHAADKIFLTVLGFGIDNRNDAVTEQIINKANGNSVLVNSQDDARKVLVDQIQGSLVTVAKDVRLQVEFNPMEVESYRLIGEENRFVAAEDVADGNKESGEIGAGHTVTALYEVVPRRKLPDGGVTAGPTTTGDLKYQHPVRLREQAASGELLTLTIFYQPPTGGQGRQIEFAAKDGGKAFHETDRDFQFAAGVAAFAMLLRDSPHKGSCDLDMVEEIATSGAIDDRSGYRDEFVLLVQQAKRLAVE